MLRIMANVSGRRPVRISETRARDPISGSSHFRTPVDKGLEILSQLRGYTTGYAVPNYVVDAPGGGGKIAMLPDAVLGRDGNDLLLRNFRGELARYPDPDGTLGKQP